MDWRSRFGGLRSLFLGLSGRKSVLEAQTIEAVRWLRAFLRFVFADWWSAMSGALSIPFVFLGALNVWSQKDLFYILAVVSMVLTLYRTWSRLQSKIIFNFDGGHILEGYSDHSFPTAKTYIANIKNEGDRTLVNCQIYLSSHWICEPFDLRPGEDVDKPVIRVLIEQENSPAVVYPFNKETGGWSRSNTFMWLIDQGSYELKLLADNLIPVTTRFTLSRNGSWLISSIATEKATFRRGSTTEPRGNPR